VEDAELSQHPVDRLIRELIRTRRAASVAEVEQIVEQMAVAPFNRRNIRVPVDERGATYLGVTLERRTESLTYHLIKRVVIEEQWQRGTTASEYLKDLRGAIRDRESRIVVYSRSSEHLAVALTATDRVVPVGRVGATPQALLLVVYSADFGIIKTGYMISSLERASIPTEAQWLR
jgi:hypothetical protein